MQIYITMRVKLKAISILFLLLIYVVSCSDQQNNTDQSSQSETQSEVSTETNTEGTSEETSEFDVYFNDQLVEKVCNCKTNSVDESGSMDVQKMRDCMGGTMIDVVKEKLGDNASEIEIEQARKVFVDKINKKCS